MNACVQGCTVTSDQALCFGSVRKREAVFQGHDPKCSCESSCLSLIWHMHVAASLPLPHETFERRGASHGSMFLPPPHQPREKGKETPPSSKSAASLRTTEETVYNIGSYGSLHNIQVFAVERKAASSAVEREPQPTASTSHQLISADHCEQLPGWCLSVCLALVIL